LGGEDAPDNQQEGGEEMSYTNKVLLALVQGPANRQEIAERAGLLTATVGGALSRMVTKGRVENIGDKVGGGDTCTAVYQIAGEFTVVTVACQHCNKDYERVFTYKVAASVLGNYRGTCSEDCRAARRKKMDEEGTRYKKPRKYEVRTLEEVYAAMTHIKQGDLAHLSCQRIDRSHCHKTDTFGEVFCADYTTCLDQNFADCTGYRPEERKHQGINQAYNPVKHGVFGRQDR
jgi:hypothetical protein